ncbi:hypothetical protein Hte_007974 [Hypoxylon texense]
MGSSIADTRNEQRTIGKPKRPVRTYSKRAASADTPEPISKKRRICDTSLIEAPKDEKSDRACEPSARQTSPSLPSPQLARKGTIMSYFKVIPPVSSSTLPSSELPSEHTDSAEYTSTPPSSPPLPSKQKKRRRLTTRIISRSASEDFNAADSAMEESENDGLNGDGKFSSPVGQRRILCDASTDTLNQAASRRKQRANAGKRKPSVVQTTLSLSSQEKGFAECKDCNMLYNPLHKQDAKSHARRHAAMLKAKSSNHVNEIPG